MCKILYILINYVVIKFLILALNFIGLSYIFVCGRFHVFWCLKYKVERKKGLIYRVWKSTVVIVV